jgi:acyl carrier protein
MKREEITERIITIAVDKLLVDENAVKESMDEPMDMSLGADSLDFVDVVMGIEREFNIMIPDEQAEECRSLNQFINVVEKITNDTRSN